MKERPILFSGPLVSAIFTGSKTQTRRIVNPQPTLDGTLWTLGGAGWSGRMDRVPVVPGHSLAALCPYGVIGDRLWVRETWQHSNHPLGPYEADCDVFYRADYLDDPLGPDLEHSRDGIRRHWRPSIHMPRTAARLILEVTDVRIERLQSISDGDAYAEGTAEWAAENAGRLLGKGEKYRSVIEAWKALWNSVATPGADWEVNPWVWVIEFVRIGGEA